MIKIINLHDAPEHLNQLAAWHHKEWAHLNPGTTIENRIHKMQTHLNNSSIPTTYIALENQLLGSAAIVTNDMETKPGLTPWLASVFVSPEHREKGIGKKLVLHVMQQAKHNGIMTLYLFTPDKALFYENLGWEIINKEQYHDTEVSIMKSCLSDQTFNKY